MWPTLFTIYWVGAVVTFFVIIIMNIVAHKVSYKNDPRYRLAYNIGGLRYDKIIQEVVIYTIIWPLYYIKLLLMVLL